MASFRDPKKFNIVIHIYKSNNIINNNFIRRFNIDNRSSIKRKKKKNSFSFTEIVLICLRKNCYNLNMRYLSNNLFDFTIFGMISSLYYVDEYIIITWH